MENLLSTIITFGLFFLVFGILVFVHELGHYLAARWVGAKVEEFALGLGWKIWGRKFGETEYKINLLPLGGYVKILGEGDDGSADDPRSLISKRPIQRIFVMVSGVFMNFLLASIIYYIIFATSNFSFYIQEKYANFQPYFGTVSVEKITDEVSYNSLTQGLGASNSGMPSSGIIKSINGKVLEYSSDIPKIIGENIGKSVKIEACSEECKIYDVVVNENGKIGISLVPNYIYQISYGENKLVSGVAHGFNMIRISFKALGDIFSTAQSSGDYSEAINTVSGPVGIFLALDFVKKYGFTSILGLTADLSLVLAFMNLLPIPALDGGRILLTLPELLTGRKINKKLETILINVSFILLLLLMLVVFVKDIVFFEKIKALFS